MTTISIAMATYNGERFLRQQLESLAQQTHTPSELVICDDGSHDSTLGIIHSFSRSAPFPVVIVTNTRRLGYTANFLQASHICKGDLVAFCDQDDEWLPEKLARILEVSLQSDALLIAHAADWIDERSNPMGVVYPTDRRFRKYLHKNDFPGHAIIIRRSLLEMTRRSLSASSYKEVADGIDFGHDVLFLEVAEAIGKIFFISDVLTHWRVYSNTKHAWTKAFESAPRARAGLASRIFPNDLSQRYGEGADSYRMHAALLGRVIEDLTNFTGAALPVLTRLTDSIKLMESRAAVMKLRAQFYGTSHRKLRLKLLIQGAAMGQYRSSNRGGVGIHNMPRDLLSIALQLP